MPLSGVVTEVAPGVYKGCTNFTEFALQELGGGLPAGLTGIALDPGDVQSWKVLDDADPFINRYVEANILANGNANAMVGIDSFYETPNQDIIEILGLIRTPLDQTNDRGWGGFALAADTGTGWHRCGAGDKASDNNFYQISGIDSSSLIQIVSLFERQTGEWMWMRYRRARFAIGSGNVNVRMKYWYGAYEDEPANWDEERLNQNLLVGPFQNKHIGLDIFTVNGVPDRKEAWAFLGFTTATSEAELDQYPPCTPNDVNNPWEPCADPVVTTWEECAVGGGFQITQDSTGLVFRDQFDRPDGAVLGNGWTDWEVLATDVQIVSEEVAVGGAGRKTGGARPAAEVAGTDEILCQMNMKGNSTNALCGVRTRWNGTTNTLGYNCRMDTRGGGQWAVVKNNSSVLAATGTDGPGGNEWRGIRVVHAGNQIRMLKTPALANGQALDQDFTLILSPTDGSIITSVDQTGFENDILDGGTFDEYILCSSKFLTVNNLDTGQKVQVDARAAVVESGGSVVIDVETWALPATTIKVLAADDTELATLTPVAGIWAGDVYSLAGAGGGPVSTTWEEC